MFQRNVLDKSVDIVGRIRSEFGLTNTSFVNRQFGRPSCEYHHLNPTKLVLPQEVDFQRTNLRKLLKNYTEKKMSLCLHSNYVLNECFYIVAVIKSSPRCRLWSQILKTENFSCIVFSVGIEPATARVSYRGIINLKYKVINITPKLNFD